MLAGCEIDLLELLLAVPRFSEDFSPPVGADGCSPTDPWSSLSEPLEASRPTFNAPAPKVARWLIDAFKSNPRSPYALLPTPERFSFPRRSDGIELAYLRPFYGSLLLCC